MLRTQLAKKDPVCTLALVLQEWYPHE